MNSVLETIISKIIKSYPADYHGDLTLTKINLMVYLVDWHMRINLKDGISNITWMNDAFGPNSKEVQDALNSSRIFKKLERISLSGRKVVYHGLVNSVENSAVPEDVLTSIKHVLKLNSERRAEGAPDPGAEFRRLVLSTYGIMNTKRNEVIDIGSLAIKYRKDILNK